MLLFSLLVAVFLLVLAWAEEIVGLFVHDEGLVGSGSRLLVSRDGCADGVVGEKEYSGFGGVLHLCCGLCDQWGYVGLFVGRCSDTLLLMDYQPSASDCSQPHRGYSSRNRPATWLSLG